jgi:hypothetical protein
MAPPVAPAAPSTSRLAGRACIAWLAAWLAAWPAAAPAQGIGSDATAKARVAATFMRFVQWPAQAFADDATPLRLCVMHDSAAVAAAFAAHDGSALANRRLAVQMNPAPGAPHCHVIFIDDSARSGTAGPARHAGSGTLTIGTSDGFLAAGGMVELVNVNDRYRFDIDLQVLREAGLTVSPGVLKLARQVRNGTLP